MPTFSRMGVWPVGYFRAFSSWILNNRRTIASRIDTLSAEIDRIGFIKVYYRAESSADGSVRRTEERIGFSVTANSTLERLLRAYIANGGNPLDISSFMYPQSRDVVGDADLDQYPHGGVLAPKSASPVDPMPDGAGESGYGYYPGGMPDSEHFFPNQQGGRISPGAYDYNPLVKSMHQIRAWANQDIKERLNDLEARIIKQCDLREQLVQERDEVLVQAFGGALSSVGAFDLDRFDPDMQVQNLIQDVNNIVYRKDENGKPVAVRTDPGTFLEFAFNDPPSYTGHELGV